MSTDPHLWLEQIDDEKALDWVRARNDLTVAQFTQNDRFRGFQERIRTILDSDDRIPMFEACGNTLYNFWQDKDHPKGLWRRTTLEEYCKDRPEWEVVLDLDVLAKSEDENWVWADANICRPECTKALVRLSRGGGDAIVVREFNLLSKDFVSDGFFVPEAKTHVTWAGPNRVLIGTDFGEGTLTDSGYPMTMREWDRGSLLEDAREYYRGQSSDVYVYSWADPFTNFRDYFVGRATDFFNDEFFVYRNNELIKIDKPDSAIANPHRGQLFLLLKHDWDHQGEQFKAGSLLVGQLEDVLAGTGDYQVLFAPTEHSVLISHNGTKNSVILNISENVCTKTFVATKGDNGDWDLEQVQKSNGFLNESGFAYETQESDRTLMLSESFLEPSSLSLSGPDEPLQVLKKTRSFFDNESLNTMQHWAESKDGTKIPYYEISQRDATGIRPTLLYGYGGFSVSLLPAYTPVSGNTWLNQGGTYVIANIRGGGEFGPEWHHQALKENRNRAYEDFIAVAEDLIRRGVTDPKHLGIQGGSNGGLLMGNMYVQRPDLFGAVVCQVPLLDMKRYHLLLAGASWMAEYGDPEKPEEWEYLKNFSAYQNVRSDQTYPTTLITTSTRDDRVHPGHARKMVAKLEEMGHKVHYYENIEGGHAGAADNKQRAFMQALVWEFLWATLAPG
ncbi:MAG: prolyl oligopeptidase family serine peptidase [Gammaproteobacteria bacterium]|nr:prolyl oligopeptidase family serine peptidase [Gammaproteobacteria bacterium]